MELYFETPAGRRLTVNALTMEYCRDDDIKGFHRFIWLDGEKDLEIIDSEIKFNRYSYNAEWTAATTATEKSCKMDPFYRPQRKWKTGGETTFRKIIVRELQQPFEGYTHAVQIYESADGGQTFSYCGGEKCFYSEQAANAYKDQLEGVEGAGLPIRKESRH